MTLQINAENVMVDIVYLMEDVFRLIYCQLHHQHQSGYQQLAQLAQLGLQQQLGQQQLDQQQLAQLLDQQLLGQQQLAQLLDQQGLLDQVASFKYLNKGR